jgi:D-alanyl-lipoteichoic acid acyltransferase DltB (MBOAT superfamily)
MNFHSFEFGLFFTAVVTAYYLLPFARRVPMLLAASLLFYLTFAAQNIYVLAGLIVSGYLTGPHVLAGNRAGGEPRPDGGV